VCQTRDLEKKCVLGSSKWTLHIPSKVTPTDHDRAMGVIVSS